MDLRSGYTGNEMGAYVEFRDEKVAFFVRQLARGLLFFLEGQNGIKMMIGDEFPRPFQIFTDMPKHAPTALRIDVEFLDDLLTE